MKRRKINLYLPRDVLDSLVHESRTTGREKSDLLAEAWERAREIIRSWPRPAHRVPHPQGGALRLALHDRDREDVGPCGTHCVTRFAPVVHCRCCHPAAFRERVPFATRAVKRSGRHRPLLGVAVTIARPTESSWRIAGPAVVLDEAPRMFRRDETDGGVLRGRSRTLARAVAWLRRHGAVVTVEGWPDFR